MKDVKKKPFDQTSYFILLLVIVAICIVISAPIVIVIKTNQALKSSSNTTPISIYYIPHQDDDAIAFSLPIAADIAQNTFIQVHLISDGANHALQQLMSSGLQYCKWHETNHTFPLTDDDISRIRTQEFLASMAALRVPTENIHLMNLHDYQIPSAWTADLYTQLKNNVKQTILDNNSKYPNASHRCSSGFFDFDGPRNAIHLACWDAAVEITNQNLMGKGQFVFYRTYVFYQSPPDRQAEMKANMSQYLPEHKESIQTYQAYDSANGKYALGMHSVPILLNNTVIDGTVYIDFLNGTVHL
ncbi:hypothetical protein VKS41_000589 [Umbelopsis sp. WA50703]